MESFNTINDLSNRICVPDKTEDLNLNFFNMITRINKSKTLKCNSCKCECNFGGSKCKSNQSGTIININVNVKTIKRAMKIIVGILLHVFLRMVSIY